MIDISVYQQFMTNYCQHNAKEIKSLFYEPEATQVFADAIVPSNWQLDDESQYCFGDEIDEQDRMAELARLQKQYGNHIKEFHRLALLNDKYCGQVVYLIAQSETGKLYMHEYVGD